MWMKKSVPENSMNSGTENSQNFFTLSPLSTENIQLVELMLI